MKKIFVFLLVSCITTTIFAQSGDNLPYVPNNQKVENVSSGVFHNEPLKDTIYCCQSRIDTINIPLNNVEFVRPKAEIIVPYERTLNSQEYYEKERQKQLEETRDLYRIGGSYYADRIIRYGFQIVTQSIFPF